MTRQDKLAEIVVGGKTPRHEWLDDPRTCRARTRHLEMLQLASLRNEVILDAGCGPGTYGLTLAELGNEVIGVDISRCAVKAAQNRAKGKGASFSCVVGDLEALPFKDGSFRICLCVWVLHHFPGLGGVFSELSRILKHEGKIFVVEPNDGNPAMRLSRAIEDVSVIRRWILSVGWDTPNRTAHFVRDYVAEFAEHGIGDMRISSCLSHPPTMPMVRRGVLGRLKNLLAGIILGVRRCLFVTVTELLPTPLNGPDLLIIGSKVNAVHETRVSPPFRT